METLIYHSTNLLFAALGALLYVLYGVLKFSKAKKGKWTLRDWWCLNRLAVFIGIVSCIAVYGINHQTHLFPVNFLTMFGMGFCLDVTSKFLAKMAAGPKG